MSPEPPVRAAVTTELDMTVFEVAACLITLAAVLSYLNYVLLKLPPAIAA